MSIAPQKAKRAKEYLDEKDVYENTIENQRVCYRKKRIKLEENS
jgi:hypothetical protein